ncbi:hypothetical protein Cch01nite_13930 [Cellulomonas chitinilytica]|uniref:Uncharacterized protein n=1 Tax=Cellulomonas chitinilytica TaxID=398759 RepID=A0A919P413_9CELL|nr:hypothetical protein [Cellulomonas chitinilytica]GIG20669.1 hypothetical protein Cch01nite_13930 [Cellulomonas chitinilytica]
MTPSTTIRRSADDLQLERLADLRGDVADRHDAVLSTRHGGYPAGELVSMSCRHLMRPTLRRAPAR